MNLDIGKNLDKMDYSTFVGLIGERNRPSGGIKTVHTVAVQALVGEKTEMLEIGSNTGFTSVNMSLLTKCKATGVDINENSISEARRYAAREEMGDRVKFFMQDATKLDFPDESFDVIWTSNTTSFIGDKHAAISEYLRVLKHGGTLVVVPIYYVKDVPDSLRNEVSDAVGVPIQKWDKGFWMNLFSDIAKKHELGLELYYEKDFVYQNRDGVIPDYVNQIIEEKFVQAEDVIKQRLKEKFGYFMNLFNENLKYCGFSILLFQKRNAQEEAELFLARSSYE